MEWTRLPVIGSVCTEVEDLNAPPTVTRGLAYVMHINGTVIDTWLTGMIVVRLPIYPKLLPFINRDIATLIYGVSQLLVDLVVLLVTWMKTFEQVKSALTLGIPVDISMTLLRDGKKPLEYVAFDLA